MYKIVAVGTLFKFKGRNGSRLFVEGHSRKIGALDNSTLYGNAHNCVIVRGSDVYKCCTRGDVFLKIKGTFIKVKIADDRDCNAANADKAVCRGCIFSVREGDAVKVKVKLLYLCLVIIVGGIPGADRDERSAVKHDLAVCDDCIRSRRSLCVAVEHTGGVRLLKIELVASEIKLEITVASGKVVINRLVILIIAAKKDDVV